MLSSSRALLAPSVMPHVEWRVSLADLTHKLVCMDEHTHTHTHKHTVKCLSSAVSWLVVKCFSLAGLPLSFNLMVWHLLHGQLYSMTLQEANGNTHQIHKIPQNSRNTLSADTWCCGTQLYCYKGVYLMQRCWTTASELTAVVKHVTSCSCMSVARQTVRQ